MSTQHVKIIVSAIDRMTAPIKRMNASVDRLKRQTAGLAKITAVGGAAAGLLLRNLNGTAAKFEKYQVMLESIEGSAEKAKKSMDWVSDIANNSTRSIDEIMESYVKLKTFGMDPTNGMMKSLLDMNARMGGSNQTLEGMVLAVGQAWTKQKLQGEEALQLIERGVPVWDLLSARTGKSVQQLMKLSAQGKLGRDSIAMLVEEMGKLSEGADIKQARTWSGMVSMLSDQWQRFSLLIMGGGLFDWMKNKLSNLLGKLNRMAASGELAALAKEIGSNILITLKGIYEVTRSIVSMASGMANFVGGWKNLFYIMIAIKGLQLAITIGAIIRSIYGMIAALVGLKAVGAGSMLTSMAGALGTLSKAWKAATLAAVAYDIASSGAMKKGGLKSIGALAGRFGMVGAAGAAGYGIGTLLNSGINSLVSSSTDGKNTSLGGLIYDKLHPQQQEVGGTLKIEFVGGQARVKQLQAKGSMNIDVDTGPMLAGAN